MSTHEVYAAYEFLYGVLSADTTLQSAAPGGVFRSLAPPSTATPFVVMSFMSGMDTLTMNAYRVLTQPLIQVKAVGPASVTSAIAQAAARVDDLLRLTNGTVSGGLIDACYRETPFAMDEIVNGELWSNLGGMYRLQLQQTS